MPRTSLTYRQAVDGFHFARKIKNLSERTIQTYDAHLKSFGAFLPQCHSGEMAETVMLSAITRGDIEAFIAYLQGRETVYATHPTRAEEQRKLSPYTVHAHTRALSAFFNWAVEAGHLKRSPMAGFKKPKVPKKIMPTFTKEEVQQLLKACEDYRAQAAIRDRALVLFLLSTGVRAKELCDLTLDRLDANLRRIHITGKGMKDRYVTLGPRAREALWNYLHVYRPQPRFDVANVFLTQAGAPLTTTALSHILAHLGERAGVKDCHPHKFRHTFATEFYRGGGDVLTLQAILGHEDLETTRVYTHITDEDTDRVTEKVNPVDRWGL